MFSNATFFRIADGFELPPLALLEAAMRKAAFAPCGPTQPESAGWIPPRGPRSAQLAELVGQHLLVKLCAERRAVPASAVKAAVEEKIERYKQETGLARVPAKLKKEFKEEVLLELLPRAFTKRTTTTAWLSPKDRMLVVDAGSLTGADRVVSALLAALLEAAPSGPALGLSLVQTQTSPAAAMSHWLATQDAPWRFTIDRECELRTPDEQKSTVRYSRHTLNIDEVPQHIAAGKVPTRLAMTWNDRATFTLTDGGQIRNIKLLDVVMEGAVEKDGDGFDADAAIMTGELSAMIPDLLLALGGEVAPDPVTGEILPAAQMAEA